MEVVKVVEEVVGLVCCAHPRAGRPSMSTGEESVDVDRGREGPAVRCVRVEARARARARGLGLGG